MSASRPTVSVLVWNLNGREHLDSCLASLVDQVYPRDRFEIVVVDNGSTDGSRELVTAKYPGVRLVTFDSNLGFCAPCNAAIRECESRFVALLNNDTRVAPDWLTELVSAAERHAAAAVGSKILSWDGATIDFAGGVTSFLGHSWHTQSGEPATRADEERPLLSACAGSALFARTAFLDAGGFDETFYACLEDVDLGWRLNLLGERVVFSPSAVTYHRVHATASRWAFSQRLRLFERNALVMIYKNYEAGTLRRVLPVAVGLLLLRATMRSGIDQLTLPMAAAPPDVVDIHPHLAASLIGLEDFCRQLPALREKRRLVQDRRRRSDAELFELFGDPLRLHETGGLYEDVARALIREFGIDELIGAAPRAAAPAVPAAASPPSVEPQPSRGSLPGDSPRVSIVILTALGPTHLGECLGSISRQSYPADRIEVIVVDNGSAVDPTSEVKRLLPLARVIRNGTNIGFAAGNNVGAAAASGDYVIFLNDDTRVHPHWLRELVETARRRHAAAVASYILDWSGTKVDFVDGAVNFQGKGFQLEYDADASRLTPEEKPLLFSCGCAMLMDRAVLQEAGGWDEGMFAYYEDVELGWRLHVMGHEVWLAPGAIVYHKHHGTSGGWPEPPRVRLYERNSLRGLFCLLEEASLRRALPAALLLAADRALLESGLSRAADVTPRSVHRRLAGALPAALRACGISRSTPVRQALGRVWQRGLVTLGSDMRRLSAAAPRSRRASYLMERGATTPGGDAQSQPIPIAAAAMLSGIYGFLSEIPQLVERRHEVQRQRRVEDGDILQRFGTHWLAPSGSRLQAEHHALHTAVAEAFGMAAISAPRPTGPGGRAACADMP